MNVKLRKQKHGKLVSTEVVARRCSVKKVFLEISQKPQENGWAKGSFLAKLQLLTRPEQNVVLINIISVFLVRFFSIFILEKQPEILNFRSFFTSKKPFGG